LKAEVRRSRFEASLKKSYQTLSQKTSWIWWFMPVILPTQEMEVGGSRCKANPRQRLEPLFKKITKAKKDWRCGSSGRAPA
jgi:hypothetical protein